VWFAASIYSQVLQESITACLTSSSQTTRALGCKCFWLFAGTRMRCLWHQLVFVSINIITALYAYGASSCSVLCRSSSGSSGSLSERPGRAHQAYGGEGKGGCIHSHTFAISNARAQHAGAVVRDLRQCEDSLCDCWSMSSAYRLQEPEEDEKEYEAATKISAVLKGHIARKKFRDSMSFASTCIHVYRYV